MGARFEFGGEGETGRGATLLPGIGKWGTIFAVSATIYFTGAAPAQAYLDPGTGSLILQATIGAIVGALVAVRIYWSKIKVYFKRKNRNDGHDDHFVDRK
jgi:hypothetical protein